MILGRAALCLAWCTGWLGAQPTPASTARPLSAAIAEADALVRAAVGKSTAGAVLLVAQHGVVRHLAAYGAAQRLDSAGDLLREPRPMRIDTRFDLASVTKVMATTMAIMLLVDQARVELDAPVARYLPEFRGVHLDSITVRHLLRHAAGLTPWQPIYYGAATSREALAVIAGIPLATGVGAERHYSDLGFMLLGYVVERVTGQRLDHFLQVTLYAPLGLRATGFVPDRTNAEGFAATEVGNGYERRMVYDTAFAFPYRGDPAAWNGWRRHVLVGEANDGNAFYAHAGVAGHAGLFSTAAELRVLVDLLLDEGRFGGRRILRASTVRTFLTREPAGHFLGWMHPKRLTDASFMHTGFTGTYVLGVPEYGLNVILLTNRQQMGVDAAGRFPDLTSLRERVTERLVAGVAACDRAPRNGC